MENTPNDYSHIKGWGVDADPTNEPTHPMKNYTGDDHERSNWERPPLQEQHMEVLKSNERPSLSAVYGTSVPPSGLSGAIRRFAFKYSENRYRHWLPLLLADRINMVEGIVEDFQRGHFPNIWAEMGLGAQWKYNRKNFLTTLAVGAFSAYVTLSVMKSKKRKSGKKKLAKLLK